jgi:4-diphosphocytidyl-2-C-methyl-D-erythritol kinase
VLIVHAYAKVNLTLEVLGKRADGYHQIVSVMQSIDLSDEVSFTPSNQLTLKCSVPSLETDDNLVLRAANLLKDHTGYSGGADILLQKHIPIASGLGGGSSNAAATLGALNRLWKLDMGDEDLQSLAALLGSDVSFFLLGGTAMAERRGEEVKELPQMPTTHLVLLAPPVEIHDKTATMYNHLTSEDFSKGEAAAKLTNCLKEGKRPEANLLFNAFEEVAFDLFPPLAEYRHVMLEAGAGWVHLAGSGPALYTFAASKAGATTLAGTLTSAGYEAYAATTVRTSGGITP